MSKIDEKTSMPVWWVWFLMIAAVSWTAIASTWVKGVNDRLSRIEDKLGINQEVAKYPGVITSAEASSRAHP